MCAPERELGGRLTGLSAEWLSLASPATVSALAKKGKKRSLISNYFNMPEN